MLLPLEADEKLEALKHYFGITYDRELIMRGIETRRHDTPDFVKQFQTELLFTLFDCDKSEDISNKTLENALFCVTKTIDKIMTGEINTNDLIISKQLRMEITKYRNIFPHVAAAIQLSHTSGKLPAKGEIIQYIYTNSQHQNPVNSGLGVLHEPTGRIYLVPFDDAGGHDLFAKLLGLPASECKGFAITINPDGTFMPMNVSSLNGPQAGPSALQMPLPTFQSIVQALLDAGL